MLTVASIALALMGSGTQQQAAVVPTFWDLARPEQVCRAVQTWVIGIGRDEPAITHSHIDDIELDGRPVFQALHRSTEALDLGYDQFVVDRSTLHPIRTTHAGPDPDVRFVFTESGAQKLSEAGEIMETTPIAVPALPEGPGIEITVQAIDWADGLRFEAVMLDRWRGQGAARAKPVVWSVEGRQTLTTLEGTAETFRTRLVPADGSFEIIANITTAQPHHITRTEYRAGREGSPLVSESRAYAAHCA